MHWMKTLGLMAGTVALAAGSGAACAQSPQPSQPAAQSLQPVKRIFGLQTAMRDGVRLTSDVWLPDAPGPFPVILVRTPYMRVEASSDHSTTASYFAQRGYAYVVQDVRGRGDSDGEFDFFFPDAEDGYDTVEAIAREPWSNGRVCTMGASYMGTVQWLAARERPPHLVCIAPTAPVGDYLRELPAVGGAFWMHWSLVWLNGTSGKINQGDNSKATDMDAVFAHRPLLTMDEALGRRIRLFREFLQHDTLDAYWKRIAFAKIDFDKIDIPTMTTTGWFDHDQPGALFYWYGLHRRTAPVKNAFLTIGPWLHHETIKGGAEQIGDIRFGKESIVDNKAAHLAFFDHYLKQSTPSYDMPKVRIYVTGVNAWRNYESWPLPAAKPTRLYLASGGKANTGQGDGALSWTRGTKGAAADTYVFDPRKPHEFRTLEFGKDRGPAQGRQDILVYTSSALDKPLEVIGEVEVELWAASDAKDTDFTAMVEDVTPDGKSIPLGPRQISIVRGRYRGGPEARPQLLTPGKPELYRIAMGAIGHVFLPGHRIRVEISSSAYPKYNPNQNTGNPIATDTEWKTANQRILHDAKYPSALVLPIVPAGAR